MFIGPVFTQELVTSPRRLRFYAARAVYVAALLALVATAWLLLTGTQDVRNVGDMARFGATLFQLLAPLQLALALFFSALLAASAVAQEKDRRTLVLLLMTRLSNSELVLGKLFSSLLQVFVFLAAALPLFLLLGLLGGVSLEQIGRVFAVTAAAALAAGSLGSMLAAVAGKDVPDACPGVSCADVLAGGRRIACCRRAGGGSERIRLGRRFGEPESVLGGPCWRRLGPA